MSKESEQLVRMARAYAAEQLPWFASALFAARLVISNQVPVAAVDEGMRIYFNPRSVEQMAEDESQSCLKQLAWIWVHEISHVLREHGSRALDRHAQESRWNIAADLEINDATWPGMEPPRVFTPMMPADFDMPTGKLAEFYYDGLSTPVAVEYLVKIEGFFDNEEDQDKAHGESVGAPSRPGDGGKGQNQPHQAEPVWPWNEGSGVHGQRCPWELDPEDASARSVPDFEQHTIRQQVAQQVCKHQGSIPGGWLRWAEETVRPKVHWKERLRRRVRAAIVTGVGQRLDYGWQRPHRRADVYAPFLRPSLQGDFLPRVACVVDTSASVLNRELAQMLAEVRSVLESLRTPIVVIPCDAVAYEPVQVLTQSDFLELRRSLRGGGGTNMVAGIEAAIRLRPAPDTVIVLTDGFTPYPERPYRVPVIFGILAKKRSRVPLPPIPPWRKSDVVLITDP